MGTPENPEQYDEVTLYDIYGKPSRFMVMYVDEEVVHLQSFSKCATYTREQFRELFERGK